MLDLLRAAISASLALQHERRLTAFAALGYKLTRVSLCACATDAARYS
jgi:hypothetical protein